MMATASPVSNGASRPSVLMLTADRRIDRRILLEADALEEGGWTVKILGMPLDKDEPDRDPRVVRIGATQALNMREHLLLSGYRHVRTMLAMNSFWMKGLKSQIWRWVVDQEKFFTNAFLQDALRHPSDVVVAHDLPMLGVARLVASQFGARLVYDNHELYSEQEFTHREKARWVEIERRHIGAANLIIAVNQSIANELKARYDVADPQVILNAEHPYRSSTDRGIIRDVLGLPSKSVIGIYQGGLSAGRNLDTLLEAVALIDLNDFHLVLLGDGQLAVSLKRRVKRMGLSKRVHFLPAVPQSELLAHSSSADFGIIPYLPVCLNTYYCTPNKLFEFIAAGLPVLASDLPELRRFIIGHDIGMVADLSNPASAARVLSRMAGDTLERKRLAAKVILAQESICWSIEGSRLVKIFEPLKPLVAV